MYVAPQVESIPSVFSWKHVVELPQQVVCLVVLIEEEKRGGGRGSLFMVVDILHLQ